MKRPLLWLLSCLILGILLESRWGIAGQIAERRLTLTLYGLLLCCWYGFARGDSARLATLVLGLLAVLTGMSRYAATNQLPAHHISRFVTDELVTLEGYLAQPPEIRIYVAPNGFEKRRYLYVETTWLEQGARRRRVCGRVRLTLGETPPPFTAKTFAYGDVLRTRLRLHLPQNSAAMGDFDYRAYLQRQGIYLVGYLRHDRYLIKLPEQQGNWLLSRIYALQTHILQFFDDYVPASERTVINPTFEAIQVIKAMTIGTGYELSPLTQAYFRQSGLYHLLVVSGVNVGILIWVTHQLLFRLLRIPRRRGNLLLPIVLFAYVGLTGFQFPVLRATLMALTVYFAITCSRLAEPLYSLAFAGALLLFLFPNALPDVSFQLTIAATGFILLLFGFVQQFAWWPRVFPQGDAPPGDERRTRRTWLRYPAQIVVLTLLMTTGAMIGVSPLLAFYFQRAYPYSFPSNLLAEPLVGLLLPLSLVSSVFSFVPELPEIVAAPLLAVNVFLAKCLMAVAKLFSGNDLMIPRPSILMLTLYYLVWSGLLSYRRKEKRDGA